MDKTIIIDIDDVLSDFKNIITKKLNNHVHKDLHWTGQYSYDIAGRYGITYEEFYDIIIKDKVLESVETVKYAKELLDVLKNDHTIVIVSSRSYHPHAYDVTSEWLKKYKLKYDHLHISGGAIKKSYFAQRYDNIVASIDDNVENCNDFLINCNIDKIILMNQPWNINENKFYRIDSLKEVLNII